jgi:hypothetical protein
MKYRRQNNERSLFFRVAASSNQRVNLTARNAAALMRQVQETIVETIGSGLEK